MLSNICKSRLAGVASAALRNQPPMGVYVRRVPLSQCGANASDDERRFDEYWLNKIVDRIPMRWRDDRAVLHYYLNAKPWEENTAHHSCVAVVEPCPPRRNMCGWLSQSGGQKRHYSTTGGGFFSSFFRRIFPRREAEQPSEEPPQPQRSSSRGSSRDRGSQERRRRSRDRSRSRSRKKSARSRERGGRGKRLKRMPQTQHKHSGGGRDDQTLECSGQAQQACGNALDAVSKPMKMSRSGMPCMMPVRQVDWTAIVTAPMKRQRSGDVPLANSVSYGGGAPPTSGGKKKGDTGATNMVPLTRSLSMGRITSTNLNNECGGGSNGSGSSGGSTDRQVDICRMAAERQHGNFNDKKMLPNMSERDLLEAIAECDVLERLPHIFINDPQYIAKVQCYHCCGGYKQSMLYTFSKEAYYDMHVHFAPLRGTPHEPRPAGQK